MIKLDLALDYPINWSFSMVLRDLIQNFYDAIGPKGFHREFIYEWQEMHDHQGYELCMKTKGHPFSYEWLIYVGASTKTESAQNNIGKYGEGFKMAALRIMQLGGMDISMHSQNWMIFPSVYTQRVGDRDVKMLGYEYQETVNDDCSELRIRGIPLRYKEKLQHGMLDFFYPENPLFGEKIGSGDHYELYWRSDMPIPCDQKPNDLRGILYVNHLARGRLDIPIIVNYDKTIFRDARSRPTLSTGTTAEFLYGCMRWWSPRDSAEVLRGMKSHWNDTLCESDITRTKYYYICQMVRNVAGDPQLTASFKNEMAQCGYIERKGADQSRNRQIEEARQWWAGNMDTRQVNPIFRFLGAENLVERYLAEQENRYRKMNERESRRYQLVVEAVLKVVPMVAKDDIPDVVIDLPGSREVDPLQFSERRFGSRKNRLGRKYRIQQIVLKEGDFADEAFQSTFVKVADAAMHIYGTSRSEKMNILLTHLGEWILKDGDVLSMLEREWRRQLNFNSDT